MTDFRSYLQNELLRRLKANPSYSMRAFAAQLDLDPSTLSKMLKGKRPIGEKLSLQLAQKLGLSAAAAAKLLRKDADESTGTDTNYRMLALDQFAVISDWYHFAILELLMIKGFKPNRKSIAKALNLKTIEVDAAVERLIRVGLLKIDSDGKWMDLSSGFTTNITSEMSTAAHKKLQEQLLTKAIQAQIIQREKRDHSAMTMAIDTSRIPEAKERIRKFRRSLTKFLTEGAEKDSVFSLNIALFPLTQNDFIGDSHDN